MYVEKREKKKRKISNEQQKRTISGLKTQNKYFFLIVVARIVNVSMYIFIFLFIIIIDDFFNTLTLK